jgi:ligand-binding sensor domain-containing protein
MPTGRYKHLFSWLFCCLFSISLCGQSYNFRNYSVEEGLPFIGVSAIYQDIRGNLWVGGYGGLSKFNGKSFFNYSPKNGLANHSVLSIAGDTSGILWVGTQTGLSELRDQTFHNYTTQDGLPADRINCLLHDSGNRLWVGTAKGICCLENGRFRVFPHILEGVGKDVQVIFEDAQHTIWIGTEKGIVLVGRSGKILEQVHLSNDLNRERVNSIFQDRSGKYWIGTDKGLRFLDARRKSSSTTAALDGINVSSVVQDLQGTIWISTELGLWKYDGKEFRSISLGRDLNANKTSCLFLDYEKNMWIGTYSGLFRYRSADFVSYGATDGLSNPFVFQLCKDKSGNLWISTVGGGISIYRNEHFYNFSLTDGLPSNNIFSIIQAKDGNMWIGSDQGLSTCPPVTDPSHRIKFTKPVLDKPFQGDSAVIVFQDHTGAIWVGGNNGVTRIINKKATWMPIPTTSSCVAYYFLEDLHGNIWIGTYLGGLFRYNGKSIVRMNEEIGMNSESCLAMKQDKEGILYFGTFEGVYVYDADGRLGKGKKTIQFTESDGMNSDLVYLMEFADEQETLWTGTNQGLNKIDIGSFKRSGKKHIVPYGKEEGFTGVECNGSAVCREPNGSLWFGTVNGLIRYNPREYKPNLIPAKTMITRIRLFYKDTLLPQHAEMSYDENNISFEYIGICLTNPHKVRYKVKLEGFDNAWSPVTSANLATYSNLPPGSYSFQVMSCNNEGVWNASTARFAFRIRAPFWKRSWFSILVSFLLVSLISLGLRYRISTIRRNEQLKVRLATNELKALRSQMNPHFIFNSLNSIQHFIMNNDEDSAAKYLNTFAKLIRTILNNSEKATVSIREEVESLKLYLQLESLRFENQFVYEIILDSALDLDYHEVPTMLIQPFAENAIIHGLLPRKGLGKLEIRIVKEGNFTRCSITDNGIGRKKAMEMKEKSIRKTHKSFGMKITQDRLELLNFLHNSSLSIEVTDLKGEAGKDSGTRVDIYIPLV